MIPFYTPWKYKKTFRFPQVQLTWSSSEVVCFSSGVLGVSFGFSSAFGADVGSSDAGSAPDKTKATNSIPGHSLKHYNELNVIRPLHLCYVK